MIAADANEQTGRLSLILRPNRALRLEGFLWVFVLLAVAAMAVAAFSAYQGNVFAPVFACIDLLIVAFAWRAIWRAGDRSEHIELTEETLSVHWNVLGQVREVARFHPYWVRLSTPDEIPGERCRLILRSHGKSFEIGRWLGAGERREAAELLQVALRTTKHYGSNSGTP
ncbi:MAG: DUF2244 domain-containing protein [Ahniella sp.]|nr:DUF2244 domain-containing protein [Ahniella sp.]